MLSMILKLFALRPILSMAIFGIPLLTVVAVGLFAIVALKVLIVVVPVVLLALLIFWFVRRSRRATVTP